MSTYRIGWNGEALTDILRNYGLLSPESLLLAQTHNSEASRQPAGYEIGQKSLAQTLPY